MANMVNCTEVRPGNFYVWDGQLYLCQAIDLNKTAMAKMKVKLKSKNVRNGSITEVSLIGGDKVEVVYVEKRKMGYLYDEGESICFMDNETYEQVSVSKILLEWEMNFLVDGVEISSGELEYGSEIEYPKNPRKETSEGVEYTFKGWDNDATIITKDEIFNAVFESNKLKYLCIFYDGNDNILKQESLEYGDKINYPDNVTKNSSQQYSYEFIGWDKSDEFITDNIVISPIFKEVLNKHNIPVVHHEMGPFRPTVYVPTIYMDFSGVNGNTEFDVRFKEFLKIAKEVPILSREELIKIISPDYSQKLLTILKNKDSEYEVGVGLQVEVDTNLLLFSNGRSWVDPILLAKADSTGKILVRPHPSAGYLIKNDNRIF